MITPYMIIIYGSFAYFGIFLKGNATIKKMSSPMPWHNLVPLAFSIAIFNSMLLLEDGVSAISTVLALAAAIAIWTLPKEPGKKLYKTYIKRVQLIVGLIALSILLG